MAAHRGTETITAMTAFTPEVTAFVATERSTGQGAAQQHTLDKALAQVQHHVGGAARDGCQNVLAVVFRPAAPCPGYPAAHSCQHKLKGKGKGRGSDIRRVCHVVEGRAEPSGQAAATGPSTKPESRQKILPKWMRVTSQWQRG